MNHGKEKCQVLKTIRLQIAQANGIDYQPHVCRHQGPCKGTCPACEEEMRFLERQLHWKRIAGRAVMLTGVSLSLMAALPAKAQTPQTAQPNCVASSVMANDSLHVTEGMVPAQREERVLVGDVVETMPMFPGGQQALLQYLSDHVSYPEGYESCAQGRVVISFIVEKDGSLSDFKVVKSVDPVLDEVALKAVKQMPKWIPGSCNGERTRVKYTVPVSFKLK